MQYSQIIGYRRNGCPIRLIQGASEPAIETVVTAVEEKTTEVAKPAVTADDVARLQAALDKERDARKAVEKEARTRGARLEELESASKSDMEKAIDAARREATAKAEEQITAAQQRANSRLVAAEVRAAAAEKQFRDPSIVARLLDLSAISVDDDGAVDTSAITRQLDQLAKDKDYLLVDTGPKRPQGDVGQGPRTAPVPEATPGLGRLRAAYAQSPTK